jgi:hypothetical protein
MAASDRQGTFMLGDGLSKVRFELVASERILTKGNVANSELVKVKDGDVVSFVEDDAEHSSGFRVAKDQDLEGSAGDAVAMMLEILDLEFHGRLLTRCW